MYFFKDWDGKGIMLTGNWRFCVSLKEENDMIDFKDIEYPAVSVQSVVLATNVLFLTKSPNFFIFLSIGIVLLLFTLQAINKRFCYYFPHNLFTDTPTIELDTKILYILTFLMTLFMLSGIFHPGFALIATIIISLSPFVWHYQYKPVVRDRITKRLMEKTYTFYDKCPCCSGRRVIKRKVLAWNRQIQVTACLGDCGKVEELILRHRIGIWIINPRLST